MIKMAETDPKSVIIHNLPELVDINKIDKSLEVMARDMVHMASCFQEMNARFEEFMKAQEDRVRNLELNCNREERWALNKTDHELIWAEINKHDARIAVMERGKCPRAGQLTGLDTRVKEIERVHQQDQGQTTAFISTREMILLGLSAILGLITIYSFIRGEL